MSTRAIALLALCSATLASALAYGVRPAVSRRASAQMADSGQCAVIELRSAEPIKLAKVLRKAWMEGGMKRGLTGSIIVPEDMSGSVQIIAQGPMDRVRSFSTWCGKQLDIDEGLVEVKEMDLDSCPAVELSSKFDLADMPRGKVCHRLEAHIRGLKPLPTLLASPAIPGHQANQPWQQLLEKAYDDTAASSTKRQSSDEGLA